MSSFFKPVTRAGQIVIDLLQSATIDPKTGNVLVRRDLLDAARQCQAENGDYRRDSTDAHDSYRQPDAEESIYGHSMLDYMNMTDDQQKAVRDSFFPSGRRRSMR